MRQFENLEMRQFENLNATISNKYYYLDNKNPFRKRATQLGLTAYHLVGQYIGNKDFKRFTWAGTV
jgi:hypothetical protein